MVNDGSGRPHVELATPVDVHFGSVQLVTSGCKFAWLYNIVLGLAGGPIRDLVTGEVAAQIAIQVPAQVNAALKV